MTVISKYQLLYLGHKPTVGEAGKHGIAHISAYYVEFPCENINHICDVVLDYYILQSIQKHVFLYWQSDVLYHSTPLFSQ